MSHLRKKISSSYIAALNSLNGKKAQRRIVVYVESYEDIVFWSQLLQSLESDQVRFEVMLPSQETLGKGKKVALANDLGERLGNCLIACVDADYDFLMQGATPTSEIVCRHPYVFHTYVYAIENFHCYAPSLHHVCVAATMTDRRIFDFERFLHDYSVLIFPLFVWSIWAYRYGYHTAFSMSDFLRVIAPSQVSVDHADIILQNVRRRVNRQIARLQHKYPEAKSSYAPLREELQRLGVTPETTYLYLRGHDLEEVIVTPFLTKICEILRRSQEREIRRLAQHDTQLRNELAGYQRSLQPVEQVLRHHMGFVQCPQYRRIQEDIQERILSSYHVSDYTLRKEFENKASFLEVDKNNDKAQ